MAVRSHDGDATVGYLIDVEPGPQFRMGTVVFVGVTDDERAKLSKKWALKAGDTYDPGYFESFLLASVAVLGRRSVAVDTKLTEDHLVNLTIEVKDREPREVELRFTRHGPVLKVDPATKHAFALRTAWSEPGMSGYLGSSRLWRARTWDAFKAASNSWGAPPLNLVYAGVAGDIGWAASGRTPVRENWDGLVPVPGDGRYEWQGFHPLHELPRAINPAKGYFATANEMNLPEGYPIQDRRLGFEWAEHSRTKRIHEVLNTQNAHTVAQSMALQTDDVSIPARRLVALLAPLSGEGDLHTGLDLLRGWDARLSRTSAAAAARLLRIGNRAAGRSQT